MVRRPPHILITTPESLYILLTAERSRQALASATTVIVDEIHAIAGDKRGAHLALSLQRLDALAGRRLQRIGLSATQKPIEEIARLLVGTDRITSDGSPQCAIVDMGHRRTMELQIEVPDQELGPIATHEMWGESVRPYWGADATTPQHADFREYPAIGGTSRTPVDHAPGRGARGPPPRQPLTPDCVWMPKRG